MVRPCVGWLLARAHVPWASSLKDRRSVVRSILDGVKSRFNASGADISPDGSYCAVVLFFTLAASSLGDARGRTDVLCEHIYRSCEDHGCTVMDIEQEVYCHDNFSDRAAES